MLSLGSSSQLGIGISIALQDKFSGTAAKVASNLKSLKNQANEAVTQSMRSYRNNAAGIAASALGASVAMGSMVEDAAEFQHRINQVAIVGGAALKNTRKDLAGFAQDMSQIYGRTPTEIASALYENAKAGITTDIKQITRYQLAVATAVGEQLEGPGGVAEKLIGIMNAYDLPTKRFGDIANAMTSVANATVSNVNDIGQAMEYAAFTAKNFNIPFEMTVAMVGKLSQAKIQGSSAGTGINNMLLQLAKSLGPMASKKSQKIWGMLGLDRGEMAGMMNQGNISGVIQALSQATSGMTPVKRTALLSDLFQRRGDRALEGIFGTQNGITVDKLYRGALGDEKRNISQTQSAQAMNDLYGSIKKLKATWEVFKQVLVDGIGPGLRVFLTGLRHLVTVFTFIARTPIGKVLFGLTAVVVPLIGIMFALRAAALTAAIALNGFGMTARAGGFRGLLGAGLDIASQGFGGTGSAGVKYNSLGRAYVGAGQSVSFMGKMFKAGQLLPAAYMGASGVASGASSAIGLLSKINMGIGKIAGIASTIMIIATVLEAMWSWLHGESADVRRRGEIMNRNSGPESRSRFGDRFSVDQLNLRGGWTPSEAAQQKILQTINVNIDGKQAMSQTFDQKMQDQMNNEAAFNTIN